MTSYVRDAVGRPTTITRGTGAAAVSQTITWDAAFNVPDQTVVPGLTTNYVWNANRQMTSMSLVDTTTQSVPYATAGQTRTWTYGYTGPLLTSIDGPLPGTGDTTTFAYDVDGYLSSVTDPVGLVTTITATNFRGQPTSIKDPNGVVSNLTYDGLGQLLTVTNNPGASQTVSSFGYDLAGNLTTITRPGGAVLTIAYDNASQVSSISNAAGESIAYTRDTAGNATAIKVKSGSTVVAQRTQAFDELGRLIKTIGAANTQSWKFGYDKTSNQTSVTDPRSKVWSSGFDTLNRLISETEPGPNTVTLTRNGKDEVTAYKDPRTLITAFVRDGFGDVIRASSPDTGNTDYTYDARGLLTQVKDARSVIANLTYDNAGRLLTRTFPAAVSENVSFTYDAVAGGNLGKGRLTSIIDPAGNSAFTYDVRGNLLAETRTMGGIAYATSYSYDAADRLLTITYPSGRIVSYARDANGKITGITTKANAAASAVTLASAVSWRPMGGDEVFGQGSLATASEVQALPGTTALGDADLLQSLTYGNGLILTRTFSQDNELTRTSVGVSTPTILDRSLGRTDNINLTGIIDGLVAANSESFSYSDAARLLGATSNGTYGTRAWAYDADGNRATETINGTAYTYAYPATSNRLTTVKQGTTTTRAFTYDAAGNITQDLRGTTAYKYAVNNAGRIVSLTIGSSLRVTYTYDAFQRLRVKSLTNGTPTGTTNYVWDSFGHIIAEHAGGGAVAREYVWLGDTPVAVFDATTSPTTLLYVHPDHLDRPVTMTDATKAVVWTARYEPFGAVSSITGPASLSARFPGQWFQLEDNLAYNWHRTYDPTLGRYSQADPLRFVNGPSVYGYAGQTPLMRVDRNGLWTINLGGSYSWTFPWKIWMFTITFSAGVAIDGHGDLGVYAVLGGGASAGTPGQWLGGGGGWSNADNICDLIGPFDEVGGSLGDGPIGASGGYYWGPSDDGPVRGGEIYIGPGAGFSINRTRTNTWVKAAPLVGSKTGKCGCH